MKKKFFSAERDEGPPGTVVGPAGGVADQNQAYLWALKVPYLEMLVTSHRLAG